MKVGPSFVTITAVLSFPGMSSSELALRPSVGLEGHSVDERRKTKEKQMSVNVALR